MMADPFAKYRVQDDDFADIPDAPLAQGKQDSFADIPDAPASAGEADPFAPYRVADKIADGATISALNPPTREEMMQKLRKEGPGAAFSGPRTYGGLLDKSLSYIPDVTSVAGDIVGGSAGALAGLPTGGTASPALAYAGMVGGGAVGRAAGIPIEEKVRNFVGLPRERAETIPQALTTGAIGSAIGGIAGPALKTVGRGLGLKSVAEHFGRKQATSSFLPTTAVSKMEERAIIEGAPTLGEKAVERDIVGMSTTKSYKAADAQRAALGEKINKLMADADKSGKLVDLNKAFEELTALKNKYLSTGGKAQAQMIDETIEDTLAHWQQRQPTEFISLDNIQKGFLTPSEATILKRDLVDMSRDAYASVGKYQEPSPKSATLKDMADGIRVAINEVVPEASFANQEYHIYDEIAASLAKQYRKDLERGGLTLPVTTTTIGGGVAGGAIGALAAAGAYAASKSLPIKTFMAAQLKTASKSMGKDEIMKNISANFLAHPTFKRKILRVLARTGQRTALASEAQQAIPGLQRKEETLPKK